MTLSALSDTRGLADPLVVTDTTGWTPAADLVSGAELPALLATAERQWSAAPHAAATLAWKSYTYWLTLPAVLSWATARRVPLLDADSVLVRLNQTSPLLRVGLRAGTTVAVLPDDPLATSGHPDIFVAPGEEILLKTLRVSLFDRHLDPLSERIRAEVKVGRRTLLGSVASGISYALLRARPALPCSAEEAIGHLLTAFDLDDLVELVPNASGEPAVHRRTCCLAFTLPEPKVCTGCCLR